MNAGICYGNQASCYVSVDSDRCGVAVYDYIAELDDSPTGEWVGKKPAVYVVPASNPALGTVKCGDGGADVVLCC